MRDRFTLLGLVTLGVVAVGLPAVLRSRTQALAADDPLPSVHINFPTQPYADLFEGPASGDGEHRVPITFTDLDQPQRTAKASLRGFSDWHHGTTKPSLRIRHRDKDLERAGATLPADVELSRPEDPLALCNWLPDQLCNSLGLLHERSQPVHLWIDGRSAGVYLRSLRPGDDLAAAFGRPRGTFWKGDSLGERRRIDLWSGPQGWRSAGADNPRATRALDLLLESLRSPASAATLQRLASVFDLEAAARSQAVAVLVGSIHADRAHNHVFFFDPARDRLEPLLWDANAFGIHAEPDLPVEVARHPLVERLLTDPCFVHRRNELLWKLLAGEGSAMALTQRATQHFETILPALQHDPEIAELELRRGVFTMRRLSVQDLPAAQQRFRTFVERREEALHAHFATANAAARPLPGRSDATELAVFGAVAVRLSRTDGEPLRAIDGRAVTVLWPGLTAQTFTATQHVEVGGRGIDAPFARPAPLFYELDVPPTLLRAHNAFTGEPVALDGALPARIPVRSVHPWSAMPPMASFVRLGPGQVELHETLVVPTGNTLQIAAGTRIVLTNGAGIRCRGSLHAIGEPSAPIVIQSTGNMFAGIECTGSPSVRLTHLEFEDLSTWTDSPERHAPALALRACTSAQLTACRLQHLRGHGIEIVQSRVELRDCVIHRCGGSALVATGAAEVLAQRTTLAFARYGATATDGARMILRECDLRGNLVGAMAARSARNWPGGVIQLAAVTCEDNGQCDVDADAFGSIELAATRARPNPLATARITRTEAAPAAAPR
jgi:hypothetical protein